MDKLRARWATRTSKREEWKKAMELQKTLREKPAVLMNTTLAETEKDISTRERG